MILCTLLFVEINSNYIIIKEDKDNVIVESINGTSKKTKVIEEVETRKPNERVSIYQSMMRSELSLCILDMCCDPGGEGGEGRIVWSYSQVVTHGGEWM